MTKFIPAVPRLTAKCGGVAYHKPSFSYYIDRDKTGCINGQLYHGVVVAKLSGGVRDLANIWTKRDAFRICELGEIASLLHVNSDLGPAYCVFEVKAYCSVDDKWDENEGMKIARRNVNAKEILNDSRQSIFCIVYNDFFNCLICGKVIKSNR